MFIYYLSDCYMWIHGACTACCAYAIVNICCWLAAGYVKPSCTFKQPALDDECMMPLCIHVTVASVWMVYCVIGHCMYNDSVWVYHILVAACIMPLCTPVARIGSCRIWCCVCDDIEYTCCSGSLKDVTVYSVSCFHSRWHSGTGKSPYMLCHVSKQSYQSCPPNIVYSCSWYWL